MLIPIATWNEARPAFPFGRVSHQSKAINSVAELLGPFLRQGDEEINRHAEERSIP